MKVNLAVVNLSLTQIKTSLSLSLPEYLHT